MTSNNSHERRSLTVSSEQLSRVRWGRVLVGGVVPHVGWNVALALLVVLGTEPSIETWLPALSNPGLVGPYGVWGVPITLIVFTWVVAAIVGRSVRTEDAGLHGLLIGLVAAIVGLTFGQFVVTFVLVAGAGWIGGKSSRIFA